MKYNGILHAFWQCLRGRKCENEAKNMLVQPALIFVQCPSVMFPLLFSCERLSFLFFLQCVTAMGANVLHYKFVAHCDSLRNETKLHL